MRRLVLLVVSSTLALAVLVAALGYGVWASLTTAQQDVVADILAEQAGLLVGCVLLLVTLLVVALAWFLGRYVTPALRLAAAVDVIAAVDADRRAALEGAPELRAVAAAVNRLAAEHGALRRAVDEAAQRARAGVEEERDRLAALMANLTQAVLVCNLSGRILLYNPAARQLLGERADGGFVGLGRSVFAVVDRDLVLHALDYVRDLADRGETRPVARFATEAAGRLVRAHLVPVGDAAGAATGFVLTLEDVTHDAEVAGRRGAVLSELVDRARRSVANIRAAIETVQDYGEVEAAERERFLAVVREEAAALSDLVGEALARSADLVGEHWALEDMRGRDLLVVMARSVQEPPLHVDDHGSSGIWLRADAYALTQAVSAVARRLAQEHGVAEITLALRREGAHGALDLGWAGRPLAPETLRAWEDEAIVRNGRRLAFSLRDVLDRHGAEAWSQPDDSGDGAVLRLLLPLTVEPDRTQGATVAGAPPGDAAERPAFYDFDLFDRIEPESELEATPLSELSYTVFDSETTGLDPVQDELIAIGAVRIVNGRLLAQETFDQLIDPRRPISDASVRIHGITQDMLEGQPPLEQVLPRFARFAEDTVLVGHNVGFDLRFLAEKEARTGVRLRQPVLDTLLLSPVARPDEEDHSLETIAARLGVSVIGRHTALGDALLTAELFLRLVRLLEQRGVLTLGQALQAARRTYQARVSESLYGKLPAEG